MVVARSWRWEVRMGSYCLMGVVCVCVCVSVCVCVHTQLCPTLQSHGLQPTRLLCPWDSPDKRLEWVAISFSRGSSRHRDQTCIGRWNLKHCTTWETCLMGTRFQFWARKHVLETDGGDSWTAIWMYLMPLNCTSKMIKIGNSMLGTFCHTKNIGKTTTKPVLAKIVIAKQDTHKGSIQATGYQFARSCLILNFF